MSSHRRVHYEIWGRHASNQPWSLARMPTDLHEARREMRDLNELGVPARLVRVETTVRREDVKEKPSKRGQP